MKLTRERAWIIVSIAWLISVFALGRQVTADDADMFLVVAFAVIVVSLGISLAALLRMRRK